MKKNNENLLNQTLVYSTLLNISKEIKKLKKIFISYLPEIKKEYLEYWFYCFEKEFYEKDIKIVNKEYKWFQQQLRKIIKLENKPDFFSFKTEKEKLFPWDEDTEFELLEYTISLEEIENEEENLTSVEKQYNDILEMDLHVDIDDNLTQKILINQLQLLNQ